MSKAETGVLFSNALVEFLDARDDLRRERSKMTSSGKQIFAAQERLAEAAQTLDNFFEE